MKYNKEYWGMWYICKLMLSLKTFMCKKKKIQYSASEAKCVCRLDCKFVALLILKGKTGTYVG